MTFLLAALAVVVFLGILAAVFLPRAQKVQPARAEVSVGSSTFAVDVADTAALRSQGLSGRSGLAAGEGMWFVFQIPAVAPFWMKDMKFPIDIIWIRNGAVTGFVKNASPQPGKTIFTLPLYFPPGLVDRVLEVPAGTVAQDGIKVGDAVVFKPGVI